MEYNKNIDWADTSLYDSSGTININNWTTPTLIKTQEVGETIEMLYMETSLITYTSWPPQEPEEKVFKIVYSCKDGKWHKSEPIYGKIIPAQEERYEFD